MKGLSNLYYGPGWYTYPYYASPQSSNNPYMTRNLDQENGLLAQLKNKASTIDLYERLMQQSPEKMQPEIQQILDVEKNYLQQLTDLYISYTGFSPTYAIEKIPFHSFEEGLQRAYEKALEEYESYRNLYSLLPNTPTGDLYARAVEEKAEHVNRLNGLYFYRSEGQSSNGLNLTDYGPHPFVIDIREATLQNETFRTALWTGNHLQLTLMSLHVGEDIGLEVHPQVDQFLRIEQGEGIVQMGESPDHLNFVERVQDDSIILIPAGKWHNVTNTGKTPLKLYSIYAPPNHPHGTVHRTKADAMKEERHE